jgi:hypothetical protein
MFHVKHRARRLAASDEAALGGFREQHPDSSMFLRSNLRRSGRSGGFDSEGGTA